MAVDLTAAVLGIVIGLGVAIGVLLVVLAVYCKARRDVELVASRRRSQARGRRTKFTSTELRDADNNNRQVVYAPNDEIRVYDDDNRPPQMYGIAYRPRMYFPDVPAEVARPQLVDGFPDGPVDYGFVSRPAPEIFYQPQQNPPRQQLQFVEVYRDNAAYRDDVETQPAQPTQPTQPAQQVNQAEHRWTDDRRVRETEEQSEDSDDSDESEEQETVRRPAARPMNIDRRHHIMTPYPFNLFQPPQTAIVALPATLPAAAPALQAAPAPAPAAPVQPPPAPVQPTPTPAAVPVQQPATSVQSADVRREPEFTWTATSSGNSPAVVSNFVSGAGYVAAGARPDSGGYAMFGRTDDGGFSWQQQLQQPREFEEQERSAVKGDSGGGRSNQAAAGASSESYVARAVVVDADVRQRSAAVVAGVHGQQRASETQERSATVDLDSSSSGAVAAGAVFSASAYSRGFQ